MPEGHALDWNDAIQKDNQYILLPEGDYPFTIDHYERARHDGSEKIPPCPKSVVYFNIQGDNGEMTQIRESYILWSSLEWKLSELFRSVGLKKKGEPLNMQWDKLPGLSGRCKIKIDADRKDPEKKYNHIDRLYPADGADSAAKWAPGKF